MVHDAGIAKAEATADTKRLFAKIEVFMDYPQ